MKNLIKIILLFVIVTSVSSCRLIAYTKKIDTSIRKKGLDPTALQFYTSSEFKLTLDSNDVDYKITSGKLKQTNTHVNDLLYCKRRTKCILESPVKTAFQKYVFDARFDQEKTNPHLILSFIDGNSIKIDEKKYRVSMGKNIRNSPDTRRVCLMIKKSDLKKLDRNKKRIKGRKI